MKWRNPAHLKCDGAQPSLWQKDVKLTALDLSLGQENIAHATEYAALFSLLEKTEIQTKAWAPGTLVSVFCMIVTRTDKGVWLDLPAGSLGHP